MRECKRGHRMIYQFSYQDQNKALALGSIQTESIMFFFLILELKLSVLKLSHGKCPNRAFFNIF